MATGGIQGAVGGVVDQTMDMAGDLAGGVQSVSRGVSNRLQNTVNRAIEDEQPEDMVQIHPTGESETCQRTGTTDPESREPASDRGRYPVQQLWSDKHTVKEPTRWGVATHDVSFSGPGGLIFLLMLTALVLLLASFASVGWAVDTVDGLEDNDKQETINKGLWEECSCQRNKHLHQESHFTATQVMVTMGFVTSLVSALCATLYMCLCLNVLKKTYLLFALIATSATTVLLYFVALIVFAAGESMHVGWSYGMSVVGAFMVGAVTVVSLVQLRRSVALLG